MFAEAMTGIALVKTAVDSIKSAITTANDISSIAGDIDKLLSGEQQIQKKKASKQKTRSALVALHRKPLMQSWHGKRLMRLDSLLILDSVTALGRES